MNLRAPHPQALVIFGASGDLAKKRILPALYNLAVEGLLPERHVVIGFGKTDWDDEAMRAHAREAVELHSRTPLDEEVFEGFARSLSYITGSAEDPTAMGRLKDALDDADREHGCAGMRLFYLAVPSRAFPVITEAIGGIGANTPGSALVVEKPFGHSLESSHELTRTIHGTFDESQVFRIDHYLGKETVQNLVIFRFANALWERVWNRDAIDHVELTVAEDIDVAGRAAHYEHAGAIRDLLQNHMLQVLAFLTMEPPRALESEAFRDETAKLLRAIRPIDPAEAVRGQYEGYRKERGVDPRSGVETFVAARLWIDNWRWDGVPFYVRHGKCLPVRTTLITVVFRRPPDYLFEGLDLGRIPSNHLSIRVQPDEGISLSFQAKQPGPGYEVETVHMDFDYAGSFANASAEAYERLLHDAMEGDHTLFTREDATERAWEIVTPLLEQPGPLFFYGRGSWGPRQADELIAPDRWNPDGS